MLRMGCAEQLNTSLCNTNFLTGGHTSTTQYRWNHARRSFFQKLFTFTPKTFFHRNEIQICREHGAKKSNHAILNQFVPCKNRKDGFPIEGWISDQQCATSPAHQTTVVPEIPFPGLQTVGCSLRRAISFILFVCPRAKIFSAGAPYFNA